MFSFYTAYVRYLYKERAHRFIIWKKPNTTKNNFRSVEIECIDEVQNVKNRARREKKKDKKGIAKYSNFQSFSIFTRKWTSTIFPFSHPHFLWISFQFIFILTPCWSKLDFQIFLRCEYDRNQKYSRSSYTSISNLFISKIIITVRLDQPFSNSTLVWTMYEKWRASMNRPDFQRSFDSHESTVRNFRPFLARKGQQ